jgi:hypothetical protein
MMGCKWIGDDGTVLLAVGEIDNPDFRILSEDFVFTSFTLNSNQRLVGVKSGSEWELDASHHSF